MTIDAIFNHEGYVIFTGFEWRAPRHGLRGRPICETANPPDGHAIGQYHILRKSRAGLPTSTACWLFNK